MMNNPEPGLSTSLWVAKAVGALAGSAISLAYVLPHGRREAGIRFLTGIAGGFLFGTPVGIYLEGALGLGGRLTDDQTVLMGAGVASLSLWWAIGFALRASNASLKTRNSTRKENDS